MFSPSAVVQAAHPIVVYSQRLPFGPPTFVSGLAADHSGATYLVRGLYYAGGAYVSKLDASGHLWTVRIGDTPSEKCWCCLASATSIATDTFGQCLLARRSGVSRESWH